MRQVAASVEGSDGIEASALCVVREHSGTRRVFPYLVSRSSNAIQALLRWFDDQCGPAGSAMAFVEAGSPVEQMLVGEMGWTRERYFPYQLTWGGMRLRAVREASLDARLRFERNPSLDIAAKLFVDAFREEWRWYFSEMMPPDSSPDEPSLLEMATKYLGTASQLFVLLQDEVPVGISSGNYDSRAGRAEFHTGVGVHPAARGQGLGGALARRTVDWGATLGARSLDVRTQSVPGQRNANLKTYEGLGGTVGRVFALLRAPTAGESTDSTEPVPKDGRGWFRTTDLSRVKRALSH
jgi:GNAT superfamily N-acetyltransferase